ncbi:uncharacterized protein KIAA0513-like [Styela clava]
MNSDVGEVGLNVDGVLSENEEFIREYVYAIFENPFSITHETHNDFGTRMKNADSRLIFAKYVDAYRSTTKCVNEITFYNLLHSFALVLFECAEGDNFKPGRILMNMAFTYYYIPNPSQIALEQFLHKLGNETDKKKQDTQQKMNKRKQKKHNKLKDALITCKGAFKEFDIVVEMKQSMDRMRMTKPNHHSTDFEVETSRKEKYLYEYLTNQPIWRSTRFWEEAFLVSVSSEKERRCTIRNWSKLDTEERNSMDEAIANITFGQLGAFINNMKCLGISKDIRKDFLSKQSTIGGIDKNGELYEMLLTQVGEGL